MNRLQERKVVTVLFCDLVGSTAKSVYLAEGDPPVALLAEAAHELLELGDREGAAEAESYRALALWSSGVDAIGSQHVLEIARSAAALLDEAPTSAVKAYVVANHARYLSLNGYDEEAIEVGQRALAMADELALSEIRGNALNTLGMARVSMGDVDGLEELEESLRLSLEHGSQLEIGRSANNLGVLSWIAGRTTRAAEVVRARVEWDASLGFPTWWGETLVAVIEYELGEWDSAVRQIDAIVDRGYPSADWLGPRGARAVELAPLLDDLARPVDPIREAVATCPGIPWVQAAAALARGDLEDAVERLQTIGCPPLESQVRLRLARRLMAEGRPDEARARLGRALDFWHSVGASRYLREAEVLLERSSSSAPSSR